MNGMDIVRHGVDMLLRNLGMALRISVGPFVILALATLALGAVGLGVGHSMMGGASDAAMGAAMAGGLLGGLLWLLLYLVTFAWVAVAWHRYVLLEEAPAGLLPAFRSELVWPYLGRSILLALVMIAVAIPVSLVLGLVAASQSMVATVLAGILMWLALGWIGMRLSLVLPARAVDKPIGMGDSWAATAPAAGAIALLVFLLAVINVVLGLIFGQAPGILGGLLSIVLQWFTTMLGLSILTTLYGALVERRQLAA